MAEEPGEVVGRALVRVAGSALEGHLLWERDCSIRGTVQVFLGEKFTQVGPVRRGQVRLGLRVKRGVIDPNPLDFDPDDEASLEELKAELPAFYDLLEPLLARWPRSEIEEDGSFHLQDVPLFTSDVPRFKQEVNETVSYFAIAEVGDGEEPIIASSAEPPKRLSLEGVGVTLIRGEHLAAERGRSIDNFIVPVTLSPLNALAAASNHLLPPSPELGLALADEVLDDPKAKDEPEEVVELNSITPGSDEAKAVGMGLTATKMALVPIGAYSREGFTTGEELPLPDFERGILIGTVYPYTKANKKVGAPLPGVKVRVGLRVVFKFTKFPETASFQSFPDHIDIDPKNPQNLDKLRRIAPEFLMLLEGFQETWEREFTTSEQGKVTIENVPIIPAKNLRYYLIAETEDGEPHHGIRKLKIKNRGFNKKRFVKALDFDRKHTQRNLFVAIPDEPEEVRAVGEDEEQRLLEEGEVEELRPLSEEEDEVGTAVAKVVEGALVREANGLVGIEEGAELEDADISDGIARLTFKEGTLRGRLLEHEDEELLEQGVPGRVRVGLRIHLSGRMVPQSLTSKWGHVPNHIDIDPKSIADIEKLEEHAPHFVELLRLNVRFWDQDFPAETDGSFEIKGLPIYPITNFVLGSNLSYFIIAKVGEETYTSVDKRKIKNLDGRKRIVSVRQLHKKPEQENLVCAIPKEEAKVKGLIGDGSGALVHIQELEEEGEEVIEATAWLLEEVTGSVALTVKGERIRDADMGDAVRDITYQTGTLKGHILGCLQTRSFGRSKSELTMNGIAAKVRVGLRISLSWTRVPGSAVSRWGHVPNHLDIDPRNKDDLDIIEKYAPHFKHLIEANHGFWATEFTSKEGTGAFVIRGVPIYPAKNLSYYVIAEVDGKDHTVFDKGINITNLRDRQESVKATDFDKERNQEKLVVPVPQKSEEAKDAEDVELKGLLGAGEKPVEDLEPDEEEELAETLREETRHALVKYLGVLEEDLEDEEEDLSRFVEREDSISLETGEIRGQVLAHRDRKLRFGMEADRVSVRLRINYKGTVDRKYADLDLSKDSDVAWLRKNAPAFLALMEKHKVFWGTHQGTDKDGNFDIRGIPIFPSTKIVYSVTANMFNLEFHGIESPPVDNREGRICAIHGEEFHSEKKQKKFYVPVPFEAPDEDEAEREEEKAEEEAKGTAVRIRDLDEGERKLLASGLDMEADEAGKPKTGELSGQVLALENRQLLGGVQSDDIHVGLRINIHLLPLFKVPGFSAWKVWKSAPYVYLDPRDPEDLAWLKKYTRYFFNKFLDKNKAFWEDENFRTDSDGEFTITGVPVYPAMRISYFVIAKVGGEDWYADLNEEIDNRDGRVAHVWSPKLYLKKKQDNMFVAVPKEAADRDAERRRREGDEPNDGTGEGDEANDGAEGDGTSGREGDDEMEEFLYEYWAFRKVEDVKFLVEHNAHPRQRGRIVAAYRERMSKDPSITHTNAKDLSKYIGMYLGVRDTMGFREDPDRHDVSSIKDIPLELVTEEYPIIAFGATRLKWEEREKLKYNPHGGGDDWKKLDEINPLLMDIMDREWKWDILRKPLTIQNLGRISGRVVRSEGIPDTYPRPLDDEQAKDVNENHEIGLKATITLRYYDEETGELGRPVSGVGHVETQEIDGKKGYFVLEKVPVGQKVVVMAELHDRGESEMPVATHVGTYPEGPIKLEEHAKLRENVVVAFRGTGDEPNDGTVVVAVNKHGRVAKSRKRPLTAPFGKKPKHTQLIEKGSSDHDLDLDFALRGTSSVNVIPYLFFYNLSEQQVATVEWAQGQEVDVKGKKKVAYHNVSEEVTVNTGSASWSVITPGYHAAKEYSPDHYRVYCLLLKPGHQDQALFPGGRGPSKELMEELALAEQGQNRKRNLGFMEDFDLIDMVYDLRFDDLEHEMKELNLHDEKKLRDPDEGDLDEALEFLRKGEIIPDEDTLNWRDDDDMKSLVRMLESFVMIINGYRTRLSGPARSHIIEAVNYYRPIVAAMLKEKRERGEVEEATVRGMNGKKVNAFAKEWGAYIGTHLVMSRE